jgi:ribonuclease T1
VTRLRPVLALVVALVAAAAVGWTQGGDTTTTAPDRPGASSSPSGSRTPGGTAGTDPESGLVRVDPGDLPQEARETLDLIDRGGPFPYDEDGGTFGNFEGLLPDHQRGYYREYTVDTPGSEDRGARRVVTGDGGEYYWTRDHYESFERIVR